MHLLKSAAVRLASGTLALTVFASPAFAISASVDADAGLRMRESSSTSAAVLTTIPNGAEIDVLAKTEGGWYQVDFDGNTGFVSAEYVVLSEEADTLETLPEPMYGRVTEGPLNIRSGPGTDYDRVRQINVGNVLEITDTVDGWYAVEGGYVISDYVTIIDAEEALAAASSGSAISDYALQFVGCRYVYGGMSPSGFDCSGFVKYVYSNFGYNLNRTASDQMSNGVTVADEDLQPGDLVFFYKPGSGARRASHVGIYIGGGQFVHASTSTTGVIISELWNSYYTTEYIGARRIV